MGVEDLVGFLVKGLVDNPDDVKVTRVDGDAMAMIEVTVHPSDLDLVKGEGGVTLRHLRAVASAASGRRKAVLELVDAGAPASMSGDEE